MEDSTQRTARDRFGGADRWARGEQGVDLPSLDVHKKGRNEKCHTAYQNIMRPRAHTSRLSSSSLLACWAGRRGAGSAGL